MSDMNNTTTAPGRPRPSKLKKRVSTLPKPRSKLSKLLITVVGLASMTVSVLYSKGEKSITDVCLLSAIPFSMLFLMEVLFRLVYVFEELQHLNTRYENSPMTLFKDVFHFTSSSWMIAICSAIMNLMRHDKFPLLVWFELGPISALCSLLGALFLSKIYMQLEDCPLYDSLWIENSHGLDYGSGMAQSFFHGYLKLVIPKTGTPDKNLEELMKDYEDKNGVQLVCYKLFILIPKSLFCPTSLMDEQVSPSIEESRSLEPKIKTVAGVKGRVYNNTVYKIKRDNGKRIYVCAEYATTLKTFKDALNHNGENSYYYKKYRNEIILQFYLTLKKVLKEHEDCTDYCEPIFYDDKDEHGQYKDVGQVLLNRVRKLKKAAKERQ